MKPWPGPCARAPHGPRPDAYPPCLARMPNSPSRPASSRRAEWSPSTVTKTPVARGAPPGSHLGRRQPHPRRQQGRPAGRQGTSRRPRNRVGDLPLQRRSAQHPWLSCRDDAHGHHPDRHLHHAPGNHDQVTSLTAHASSGDHPRGQSYPARGALTRPRPSASGSSSFIAEQGCVNPLELRRFRRTARRP